MRSEVFEKVEKELMAFVNEVRDKLDSAMDAIGKAREMGSGQGLPLQ
jgi:hypothetical protein